MLTCFLKRVLPFLLTLTFGVATGNIFRPANTSSTNYRAAFVASNHKSCPHRFQSYSSSPLVIKDVPEIPVRDAVRLSGTFTSTLRFHALLGSDGNVWDVSPLNVEPPTFKRIEAAPATSLGQTPLVSLQDLAMDATRQIQFSPAKDNGEPTSAWVVVTYEFSSHPSPDCPKCSTTSVTVSEDGNTLWHKESHGE